MSKSLLVFRYPILISYLMSCILCRSLCSIVNDLKCLCVLLVVYRYSCTFQVKAAPSVNVTETRKIIFDLITKGFTNSSITINVSSDEISILHIGMTYALHTHTLKCKQILYTLRAYKNIYCTSRVQVSNTRPMGQTRHTALFHSAHVNLQK